MTEHPGDYEYERRFLVADRSMLDGTSYETIEQGYLWAKGGYAVRIRLVTPNMPTETDWTNPGVFSLKGPRKDARRFEVEMPIPRAEAEALMSLCNYRIKKRRHAYIFQNDVWMVDEFLGDNAGLIIAELEGSPATIAALKKPSWANREITDDRRYDNEQLARQPLPEGDHPPK